jgi:hypothetical protein
MKTIPQWFLYKYKAESLTFISDMKNGNTLASVVKIPKCVSTLSFAQEHFAVQVS